MRFLVKNWSVFQHYKDRSPPWIKLQKILLDDFDYQCLPIASRALAPMVWLLASENMDGSIDGDTKRLAFRLRASEEEIKNGLEPLVQAGFLVPAITPLAECKQVAVPEAEAEADIPSANAEGVGSKLPPCPHQEIIALYHEALPACTAVREWTPARQALLRSRWAENGKRQTLGWWKRFFDYVAESEFLTGRGSCGPDRDPFVADLEWLVRPKNFVKVIEGKYHKGAV